jgi:hypothetical protein
MDKVLNRNSELHGLTLLKMVPVTVRVAVRNSTITNEEEIRAMLTSHGLLKKKKRQTKLKVEIKLKIYTIQ